MKRRRLLASVAVLATRVGTPLAPLRLRAAATDAPCDAVAPDPDHGASDRPLRVAATDNRVCRSGYSFTYASHGRQTAVATRSPFVIGSGDRSSLVVCFDRWFREGAMERAPIGNVTMRAVIENDSGTRSARVTIDGSPTIRLAAGDARRLSDPILPNAFGLASFAQGSKWYWKDDSLFDSPAGEICENGFRAADDAGARVFCYDPATARLSAIETPGPFTVAGDASSRFDLSALYRPTIFGAFVRGDPTTLGAVVDSIVATGQGDPGGGYAARAARAAAGGPLAFLDMAVDGGDFTQVEANPKTRAMYRHASTWITEAGANDLMYSSLVRFQATETFTYAALREAGVRQIVRPAILPRTDSSDGWSTQDQTAQQAAWRIGGVVDQANAWFGTRLADGAVDAVPVFVDVLDPRTPQRWRTDGTARAYTLDGTHPSYAASALMAKRIVAILDRVPGCAPVPR